MAAVPPRTRCDVGLLLAKYEVRLSHSSENICWLRASRGNYYIGLKVLFSCINNASWITLSRYSYILRLTSYFLSTETFKRNTFLISSSWLHWYFWPLKKVGKKEGSGSFIETQIVQQREDNFLQLDPFTLNWVSCHSEASLVWQILLWAIAELWFIFYIFAISYCYHWRLACS